MRRLLVGGNWKCNGTVQFARDFPEKVLNKVQFDSKKVEVVVSPAAIHLPIVKDKLKNNV